MGALLAVTIIGLSLYLYYAPSLLKVDFPEYEQIPEEVKRQRMIERQLRELDALRADIKPLTEKEVQSQLKELEDLRTEIKPLSNEEIQRQLEELNMARNSMF